jgi:hypothetical protein
MSVWYRVPFRGMNEESLRNFQDSGIQCFDLAQSTFKRILCLILLAGSCPQFMGSGILQYPDKGITQILRDTLLPGGI